MNRMIKTVFMCVVCASLISLPCMAEVNNRKIWAELRELPDENALAIHMDKLSNEELLQLCNELGEEHDERRENIRRLSRMISTTLGVLRVRGALTPNTFLSVLKDKKASLSWRNWACNFSVGSSHFINKADIDMDASFEVYTNIILDAESPVSLQEFVYSRCARMLSDGYYSILNDSGAQEKEAFQEELTDQIHNSSLVIWDNHEKKVSWFIDFSLAESTRTMLKQIDIANCLRMIVQTRGSKTPQIDRIKTFASSGEDKFSKRGMKSLRDKLEQYAPSKKENKGSPQTETNSNKLYPALRKSEAWYSMATRVQYLRGLNNEQLLQLCDEFGEAAEKGEVSGEGLQLYITQTIGVLKEKGGLTPDTFLSVLKDRKASSAWKALACKYSTGSHHFVDINDINLEESFQTYTNIILDNECNIGLRESAYWYCASMLGEGYYWLLCDSKEQKRNIHDRDDWHDQIRNSSLAIWDDHDRRVSWFIDFSMAENTLKTFKCRSIVNGLREIVQTRGSKTPQINRIKTFASSQSENEDKSLNEHKKLLRNELEQYVPSRK